MRRNLRLRLENCVTTILELDRHLGKGQVRPVIVYQFQRLQNFLLNISAETVNEVDIEKIEEATNLLLDEISENLKRHGVDYHHRGSIN